MKKFSELSPKENLEDQDYVPIIDSSEDNPERQNKVVLFGRIKDFLMRDVDAAEAERVQAENARVDAETARAQAEAARENQETGYVNQSKSWAVGTNNTARPDDETDNSKYYASLSANSAAQAAASAEMAQVYADIVVPTFHLDLETMILWQDNDGSGITFQLSADKHLMYEFNI